MLKEIDNLSQYHQYFILLVSFHKLTVGDFRSFHVNIKKTTSSFKATYLLYYKKYAFKNFLYSFYAKNKV
jgi:hypothetical protein